MPPRRKPHHNNNNGTGEHKKASATTATAAPDNESSLYTIVNTVDRGRIVIAARDIPRGTIIHSEEPLAVWPPPPPSSNTSGSDSGSVTPLSKRVITAATSWANKHSLDASLILYPLHCLFAISPAARMAILQLHAPTAIPTPLESFFTALHHSETPKLLGVTHDDIKSLHQLASIINANAYAIGSGGSGSSPIGIAMYAFVPLLNHSCAPTCWRVASHDSSHSIIRTIQPLVAGDEITMSYLSPTRDLLRPCHQRRMTLVTDRSFHCQCQRCCQSVDCMRSLACPTCHAPILPPTLPLQLEDDDKKTATSATSTTSSLICQACGKAAASTWLTAVLTTERTGEVKWHEYEALIWPRFKLTDAVNKLSSLIQSLQHDGLHAQHWLIIELRYMLLYMIRSYFCSMLLVLIVNE
jgi:hypothetical protein